MSSIAHGLSKLNFDVNVFPDHYYDNSNLDYKVHNSICSKNNKAINKKTNIYFRSIGDEIFICDSFGNPFLHSKECKVK